MPPGVIGPCLPWATRLVAAGEMVIINHLDLRVRCLQYAGLLCPAVVALFVFSHFTICLNY